MRCWHCKGEHATVEDVKACSQTGRRQRASHQPPPAPDIDQIRAHGLAGAGFGRPPRDKAAAADELRRNQTAPEKLLGNALRAGPLQFDAQVVQHGYVVDFYCYQAMLAVEVDGRVHGSSATADQLRDDVLRANGIEVLRFRNGEVFRDLRRVVRVIQVAAAARGRRGGYTPYLEASWSLYRYGPQALGLTPRPAEPPTLRVAQPPDGPRSVNKRPAIEPTLRCSGCGLVCASVDPATMMCASCSARPTRRTASKSVWRSSGRYVCSGCRRSFVGDASATPTCFVCATSAHVQPRCVSCGQATTTIDRDRWICRRCADVRDVARDSAGSGHTPSGPLRDKRSRARRVGRGD